MTSVDAMNIAAIVLVIALGVACLIGEVVARWKARRDGWLR